MKLPVSIIAAASIAVAGIAWTTPAQAATSNVGGWTPGTVTCANGNVSVFPVVVGNGADFAHTGSYTVPTAITNAVQFASSPSGINCNGGTGGGTYSKDFLVNPGQVTVMWVGLGSTSRTGTGSHNIGFGGWSNEYNLVGGTVQKGLSWYDLGLTLNNANAFSGGDGFNNLTATYQGTGGLDPTTNNQNGFVLTNCVVTNDGSILPGPSVLTPYNSGQWTSGPVYNANQPLCAAWAPNGTFIPYTQGTSSQFTTQAAQQYSGASYSVMTVTGKPVTVAPTLYALAGSGTAVITSASFSGPGCCALPINQPSTGPWVGQDPQTLQWFVANLPVGTNSVSLNGQVVASYQS
jgi:hypothetical protein